jgi:MFS family permease
MILGMSAAALTSFLIPELNSLGALAALWAFQALCYAAGDPAEQALVADLTGGDQRGRAYGLYSMAAGLGAMLGPLVGGWLYQSVGQAAPFYANGLVLAAATLTLLIFLKEPEKRQPA